MKRIVLTVAVLLALVLGMGRALAETAAPTAETAPDLTAVSAVSLNKFKFVSKRFTIGPTARLNLSKLLNGQHKYPGAALTWQSTLPDVATVSENGVVQAAPGVRSGETHIIATSSAGVSASCAVRVRTTPVKQMALNYTRLALRPGASAALSAAIKPAEASYQTVRFTSSDPAVASVDPVTGVVRALQLGEAVITAAVEGDGFHARCALTVTEAAVATFKLNRSKATISTGGTVRLIPKITPATSADTPVAWVSGAPDVASVDENGVVTGIAPGVATVTAAAQDGSAKSASCKITVRANTALKEITFDQAFVTLDKAGDTATLFYTTDPVGATVRGAVWSSDNPAVATVSERGAVTAVSAGQANITLTAGGKSATCLINVRGAAKKSVTIGGIGDVTLGGDVRSFAQTLATLKLFQRLMDNWKELGNDPYDYVFADDALRAELANDDITLCNLECALTNDNSGMVMRYDMKYVFRGLPEYAQILNRGSIEVANLANNHALDFGAGGIRSTRNALKRYGIGSCTHSGENAIIEKNGVKVGFCGFITRGSLTPKAVSARVRALKAQCDVVVASFHFIHVHKDTWHYGSTQRDLTHAAVDAGASLVYGTHPFVLSGIEPYHGAYIAYGLGSTVTGGRHDKHTMIFRATVDVYDGFAECRDPEVVSVASHSAGKFSGVCNYQPVKLTGADADLCIAKIKTRSQQFGADLSNVNFIR